MMSNCEEELWTGRVGEGQKRQERLMDFTRKKITKKKLNHSNMNLFGIFIAYLLLYSLSLDYLHNQFLVISMERQIRVVVCS